MPSQEQPARAPYAQLEAFLYPSGNIPGSIDRQIFFNDFLQDMSIQRQIIHQPLEPRVLITQLAQLAHLEKAQVAIPLLPDVERLFADPHLPTDIADQLAGIRLLQYKQDLLLSELRSLHRFLLLASQGPRNHLTPVLSAYETLG